MEWNKKLKYGIYTKSAMVKSKLKSLFSKFQMIQQGFRKMVVRCVRRLQAETVWCTLCKTASVQYSVILSN